MSRTKRLESTHPKPSNRIEQHIDTPKRRRNCGRSFEEAPRVTWIETHERKTQSHKRIVSPESRIPNFLSGQRVNACGKQQVHVKENCNTYRK